MNKFIQTIKSLTTGVALVLYTATPVMAEDIEIYTNLGSTAVETQPNILFVMDTSGSMGFSLDIEVPTTTTTTTQVPITGACPDPVDPPPDTSGTYTSTVDYQGSCVDDQVYWSDSGTAPACNSQNHFNATANHCNDSVTAFGSVGFYIGQIAQYRTNKDKWKSIKTTKNKHRSYPIECEKDKGIHGDNNSNTGTKTYIKNNKPWNATSFNHSVWDGGGNNYTMYTGNYINFLGNPGSGSGGGGSTTTPPAPGSCPTGTFETVTTTTTTYTTVTSTRLVEMKKAIDQLIQASSNINVGLMRFRTDGGGGKVIRAMEDIVTARVPFQTAIAGLNATSGTPLAKSYYEALQYYGGRKIDYGSSGSPSTVTEAKDAGNTSLYQTPITESCQKNSIIFLSDGAPSSSDSIGDTRKGTYDGFLPNNCSATASNNCLEDLAGYAFNNDIATKTNLDAHLDDQKITTYTIGFDFSAASSSNQAAEALLRRTATAGGGGFFNAADAGSLTAAFNKIIAEILAVNSTFSSPAVSVNAFNRSVHLNDLYFTLFKPGTGNHWNGNLKKYEILFDSDGEPFVADVTGAAAVDLATGFFKDSARSFWTLDGDAPDGKEAADGGAASVLTFGAGRNSYTFTGSYTTTGGVHVPSQTDLTVSANELDVANNGITDTMLGGVALNDDITYGGSTKTYRTALLNWAAGQDVYDEDADGNFNEARRVMGDPLHSQPALVQYGGTDSNPDLVSYVATNDGYLHAVETKTGTELWTFVPQELLSNLEILFDDDGTEGKTYGLDGDVIAWINDADGDGTIEPGSGEHVYLYVGMRRGGNIVYSFDVSVRTKPKLRWKIDGGVVGSPFEEMGDTWSSINVETIRANDAEKTVLIFGAGYDVEEQDDSTERTVDTVGRGVFIVDAESGDMLWRAGIDGDADLTLTDMKYSIPSRVKPLDVKGDGFVDRLYVGDMGGQLWRFDIALSDSDTAEGSTTSNIKDELAVLITGGRIADFAKDSDVNNNRRFYYPPDVALIVEEGQGSYLAIVATSGFRAHPLQNATHDRIYMMRDKDIYEPPVNASDVITYTTITDADLYDATDNLILEGTAGDDTVSGSRANAIVELAGQEGWRIDLDDEDTDTWVGEKGLSEPLIFSNTAIVTTYSPVSDGTASGLCVPSNGTAALYFINIADATPSLVEEGEIGVRTNRKKLLKRGGIPPSPSVIITDGGDPTLCVGTECSSAANSLGITKTYWYEVEDANATISP